MCLDLTMNESVLSIGFAVRQSVFVTASCTESLWHVITPEAPWLGWWHGLDWQGTALPPSPEVLSAPSASSVDFTNWSHLDITLLQCS